MARVNVELPERFIFRTQLQVRIGDINYGGHLGNDAVLSLVHEARVQFLKSLGVSEMDVGEGTALIMVDAAVEYRGECFYGDVVEIEVGVSEVTKRSFAVVFRLRCGEREIALVRTGMLGFDYSSRKPKSLPPFLSSLVPPNTVLS